MKTNHRRSGLSMRAAAFMLFLGAGCITMFGQSNAILTGTVLDPSGKVLPEAAIQVKSDAGGGEHNTKSDNEGHFSVSNLLAGVYTVEASASGFSTARRSISLATGSTDDITLTLSVAGVSQTVTVEASTDLATVVAPSQSSLDAMRPQSIISPVFIQNFMTPVGDYAEVTLMSPGTYAVSPNGPGLGDTKTFFRGFKDGLYNMTFDTIPFNDTNDPTHHSWVWFPNEFIGSTIFDRSPGDATAIGPSNSGGSINLQSREMGAEQTVRATINYGSWNTRLIQLDYESGPFGGKAKKSNLVLGFYNLDSDGYQTYNYQSRYGGTAKYQYKISEKTVLTAFTGIVQLAANTPNVKGPTRAQIAQFGDRYLLNNNPADPLYYKYSWYQIPTDFDYVGIQSELGHGWAINDKVYTNRYYNHQQYNGATITTTSGTDKLNSYRKYGNTLSASQSSRRGTFRTGLWYEIAYTDRFQTPTDPKTWIDSLVPNFHEKFITQSLQPYGQYEFRATRRLTLTAGIKMNNYNQHLNQFADNGKTIGNLGGVAFVTHTANYRAWQPNASARYRIKDNWSAYFQYANGNNIPPSSVFDVKNASVKVIPEPTKTRAFQFGSVLRFNRVTLDGDMFFIRAQNAYNSAPDPVTGEPVYYLGGDTLTKGAELESNIVVGRGFNLYLNGTAGSAKYADTKLWVQNAPKDTETVGLTYMHKSWDIGLFDKRIGQLYNDNGATNQAVFIHPFNITNVFFNYTVKGESRFRGTKFRFGVTNLTDQHNIVGVVPAGTKTSAAAPGDTLTLMAGRSISVGMTFGWIPKR